MQTHNTKSSKPDHNRVEDGLATLNLDCPHYSSNSIMALDTLSKPAFPTLVGDYIGTESCLDLKKNNEDMFLSLTKTKKDQDTDYDQKNSGKKRLTKRDQRWTMKEFPPPIPFLARTENLPSHMPWVLKRYYTNDGRLILREEKVRHHEYFRAHRSNGRLTLQLVPLDDDVLEVPPFQYEQEEKEEEEEEGIEQNEDLQFNIEVDHVESEKNGDDGSDEIMEEEVVEEEEEVAMEVEEKVVCDEDQRVPSMENVGGNGSSNAIKCLDCTGVRTSPNCLFGVLPVPAMRPVHT